jgi:hypothetical protein
MNQNLMGILVESPLVGEPPRVLALPLPSPIELFRRRAAYAYFSPFLRKGKMGKWRLSEGKCHVIPFRLCPFSPLPLGLL